MATGDVVAAVCFDDGVAPGGEVGEGAEPLVVVGELLGGSGVVLCVCSGFVSNSVAEGVPVSLVSFGEHVKGDAVTFGGVERS